MVLLNEKEIKFKRFPNGELAIIKDQEIINRIIFSATITLLYENQDDLFILGCLVKTLKDIEKDLNITLFCPYFPYSRMDRENNDYLFTLKYVANFINSLEFDTVIINEPHSDVTPALLNNVISYNIIENTYRRLLRRLEFSDKKDYIFFPDHGAQKRYSRIKWKNILVAHKERDFLTGEIINYQITGNFNKLQSNSKVLIIDDLCSRGGTFLQAGNKLKEYGIKNVFLYIVHCENNIFNGELLKEQSPIKEIYTTSHSLMIMEQQHSKIKILEEEN